MNQKSNPQKSKEWEKKLESIVLDRFFGDEDIVQFSEKQLKRFISQLLSTQKADLKREMGEMVGKKKIINP